MSLVDDVLVEAERRRGGSRRMRGVRVDDLVPTRRDATARRAPSPARAFRRALVLTAGLAVLAVGAALFVSAPNGPASVPAVRSAREVPLATPPPVAAPLAPASPASPATIRRPTRVESISVEPGAAATRLRIVTDGETNHRLEHDAAAARLDVVLPNASLVEPNTALELLDTPIRALDLRAETPDLRVALTLDPEVRVQSRWLALPRGAALVIELQPAPQPPATAAAPAAAPAPMPVPTDVPDVLESFALPSVDPGPEIVSEAPAALADQVISPSLGNPAELRIERSRQDHEREDRAALRARIERTLADARRARTAERFEEADALYAEVVLLAPGDASALVEWSALLAEHGRAQKALALLESARTRAPRDATLLIAHARLLGHQGDLAAAIRLLDASGLAVTESPDVHVLAAAYHQRAGDHPAAIERYEQILRRFPEESRGWLGLGVSLEAVGRRDEARDVYRIALQVGELPPGSRRWLTTRLAALGQED